MEEAIIDPATKEEAMDHALEAKHYSDILDLIERMRTDDTFDYVAVEHSIDTSKNTT